MVKKDATQGKSPKSSRNNSLSLPKLSETEQHHPARSPEGSPTAGEHSTASAAARKRGITEEQWKKLRGRPLYTATHQAVIPSLLSAGRKNVDLKGLLNLMMMIVLFANMRLVIENITKYGVMITLPSGLEDVRHNWPILWCFTKMHGSIIVAWILERYVANRLHRSTLMFFQVCNIAGMFYMAHTCVTQTQPPLDSGAGVLLLCFSVTWCFKLISFHHVHSDIRTAVKENNLREVCAHPAEYEVLTGCGDASLAYPACVTLPHVYEYLCMPSICYQVWFPRTERVNGWVAAKHLLGIALCGALMKILVDQYVVITVKNTFLSQQARATEGSLVQKLTHLAERLLKLSLPILYIWLLMFVSLFHNWLNFLAEVTRFGDRQFYLDWWNASSFGEYWRKWNLPIHEFMTRHVYKPMLSLGMNKNVALVMVFFISSVLHEYVVTVPLRVGVQFWVFLAFMGQIPLVIITSHPLLEKYKTLGNCTFWVLFCFFGQPTAVLLYYWIWAKKYNALV
eukprot:GDKI01041556.1.p1 GENE.GDKI01041556.1~~GDKI01041556.1.p1  ORF type:complete len:510 (-),score=147.73 GDKI01041556.1:71-1600(-)